MDKIKQLENIAKVLGTYNVITKDEFNQVIKSVADVLKVERENIKGISEEYKQTLQSVINTISEEHDKVLQSVENTSQTAKSEATEAITKALEEVKRVAKEVMEMKPKDGERGLDADEEIIVEKVLGKIVLPEYKETVLDGGEQIVDKINALDLSPENQIDASHIKNLPEPKMIGGGSTARNLYQLNDVNISSPTSNQVLKYNSTTNLWENGSGGGSSLTLQTDGVPNTDQTLLNLEAGTNVTLTDNFAGTVTIDVTASNISLETNGIVNNSQSTLNLIAGTNVTLTDDGLGGVTIDATGGGGSGVVETIVAGNNIDVDNTDPANPIVSVETLTLSDISDVTATAAEVDILSGATITTTELNYLSGVTSPLQAQINTKASKSFAVAMAVALS